MFGFLTNLVTSTVVGQVFPAAAPALKVLDVLEGAKFAADSVMKSPQDFGTQPHNPDKYDIPDPVYQLKDRA